MLELLSLSIAIVGNVLIITALIGVILLAFRASKKIRLNNILTIAVAAILLILIVGQAVRFFQGG